MLDVGRSMFIQHANTSSLHLSITPLLQFSITPSSHYSNIPSFQHSTGAALLKNQLQLPEFYLITEPFTKLLVHIDHGDFYIPLLSHLDGPFVPGINVTNDAGARIIS